jgi:CO/xanthine dehydrogenase Mo-binding subunit
MDGVAAVFTGRQIADILEPMPIGTPGPSPEHRAVAVDTVRYTGEPVAVVVARDRYVARDAVEAISVTYDTLPAVVDPEAAMTGKPAVLHADFPNNIALQAPSGTGVTGSGTSRKVDDSTIEEASRSA